MLVEPWISPADYKANRPHMLVVDKPDLKICRMNVSRIEGDISIVHFHYLIATPDGVKRSEEIHRLALVPPEKMAGYFREAGLDLALIQLVYLGGDCLLPAQLVR